MTILLLAVAKINLSSSFVPPIAKFGLSKGFRADMATGSLEEATAAQAPSEAGKADHPFAKRFGHLANADVPTVSDAMAIFTDAIGGPINTLYRNSMSDLVATTHLSVVDARFKIDPVWSLGFKTTTDIILKNYPEQDFAQTMVEGLAKSVGLEYSTIVKDANLVTDWAAGKSAEDVASALRGEGDGPIGDVAKAAKDDEYWLYTKNFGIGLVKVMEVVGTEPSNDVMKKWVGTDMGKASLKAEQDLDQWNGLNSKLAMMETLMKEIEIREKKKMAERLEEKAAAAIKRAERQTEIDKAMEGAD
ncbi:hypothetical protein TrST_g14382 [Triparma strigata]|uniref:Uncharacterized protein n=1 Tax=Triparma strigata TaxID=1606541 RepID=A0A9W7EH24_9STRA|nr:hypothetical protein TrST_g14382 [Triparma strigata]